MLAQRLALAALMAALPAGRAASACSAPLVDTDFNGNDLPGKSCSAKAGSAAACCEQCGAEKGCSVWTYIPGASTGTCCFKVSATGRREMKGYISGCVEHSNGTCLAPIPPANRPPPPPAPPPSPPPPPCTTDEDCSLNGVCTSGACHCDPGWTTLPFGGPWCGFLDFLPSPISKCGPACAFHGGEGGVDMATTSWGGSVIGPSQNADAKYWMFAAEMAQHCTLGEWTTNSQVVTAVSDTPLGPFVRQAMAIPPWSHNPEAIRAADGTYVIFTLGPGKGLTHEKNCTRDAAGPQAAGEQQGLEHRTLSDKEGKAPPRGLVNFTVHSAPSPRGPWTATTMQVYNWNISWDLQTPGNWNPAPVALPDGTIRVMAHTDWGENGHATPSHKVGAWAGEAILEAPSWKGPYKVVGGDEIDHCNYCEEDPFMWKDKRGNWHVLYHRMFDPAGPLDPNWGKEDGSWKKPQSPVPSPGWAGGHAYSRDGLNWSQWTRCYNTSVALTDGTTVNFPRRERPKLLFDKDGTPTHLYNGAIPQHGNTYTIVSPLNVPANKQR